MGEIFRVDIIHPKDQKIEIEDTFLLAKKSLDGEPGWLELNVESVERVHQREHSTKTIACCKLVLNLVPQR